MTLGLISKLFLPNEIGSALRLRKYRGLLVSEKWMQLIIETIELSLLQMGLCKEISLLKTEKIFYMNLTRQLLTYLKWWWYWVSHFLIILLTLVILTKHPVLTLDISCVLNWGHNRYMSSITQWQEQVQISQFMLEPFLPLPLQSPSSWSYRD